MCFILPPRPRGLARPPYLNVVTILHIIIYNLSWFLNLLWVGGLNCTVETSEACPGHLPLYSTGESEPISILTNSPLMKDHTYHIAIYNYSHEVPFWNGFGFLASSGKLHFPLGFNVSGVTSSFAHFQGILSGHCRQAANTQETRKEQGPKELSLLIGVGMCNVWLETRKIWKGI